MPYLIDSLADTRREINGKWWIARPNVQPIFARILNAIAVLRGEADAVVFREDIKNTDKDLKVFYEREFNFVKVNPGSPRSDLEASDQLHTARNEFPPRPK